jgi:hypothetical protein
MRDTIRSACAFLLAATVLAATLRAQEPSKASASDVEPEAIAALNKMGAYLRTLKVFQVRAETTKEDVLDDGQKIQFASVADVLAQAPSQLRVQVKSDREEHVSLYDGKTFTLYAPRVNFYASVPAPPTIVELINRLEEKYGMEIPLTDLFRWGGPHSNVDQIKAATDIGPGEVGGTSCEHYAFRQPGLDWQVWIQLGDYPLPRKVVLTTMTDEARPQFSAIYTWNLAPSFNEGTFRFVPPPEASKIVLKELPSTR